jgi:hypothetical protein
MEPLFDPTWLFKVDARSENVPVVVQHHPDISDELRAAIQASTALPVHFLTTVAGNAMLPLQTKWFEEQMAHGMQQLVASVRSMDLSEYAAPEEKRTINKALRKKREANKASQNARGRKWWEHR